MKSMGDAIQKLEGKDTQLEYDDGYKVNGKMDVDSASVRSSLPPEASESCTPPYPQSYTEMVQRGESSSNILDINYMPPNPDHHTKILEIEAEDKNKMVSSSVLPNEGLGQRFLNNPPSHKEQFTKGYEVDELLKDCLSLLDNREKYYEGSKNGSILKDHVLSLKKGLEFLGKLCLFSTYSNLAKRMRHLSISLKHHSLTIYEEENEDLQRIIMILVSSIIIGKSPYIIDRSNLRHNYGRIIDLLLENISVVKSTWYNNNNTTADAQAVALEKKVGELRMALTCYKPLCICLAHPSRLGKMNTSLDSVINDAAIVIYLLFVDKMDKKTLVNKLNMVMHNMEEIGLSIYYSFLKVRSLDKLIHILATNSDSLNEPNKLLYVELRELQTFVANRGSKMLNQNFKPTESTDSICYQAVPIVSSIYIEEDMHRKLDHILMSVVGPIKLFKLRFDSQEIKLYDYPRVDGLGFLEFFLGNLKELQGHNNMSVIRNEMETLHMDIHSLVSSPKISEEKRTSGGLWTTIVQLAYQAEYVMDLYLVIPDSRCISTLCNIVEEVKEIKEKVLALPDKSLHVENVALTTSSPVHDKPLHVNDVLVGFQEEIDAIKKDLLTGESALQIISVVGMGGAGKTSLAKHLFEESSVKHFDTKAWCTVSQAYQMKDLLLKIFNQINKSDIRDRDEQELADELCRSLKRRRYLGVIDDVWDFSIWNYLRRYFPVEETQSRILITTRDSDVALETNSKIYQLRALTEDESWKLLKKKLPQQESFPKHIESIAKEVAKNCKGLPLSIIIIGSLLHHAAINEEMWNQIAKDVTSTILSDPRGKCKAILELSYNHLPDNLKSCFLYLGVFPEDREISVTRLVRLWVAEGLVRGRMDLCMEDVGKRYVNDLISRSLVIPIKEKKEGGVKSFQLQDLLRDFCLKKAEQEHFFTVLNGRGTFHLSQCPRRMSITHLTAKNLHSFSWNSVRTVISSYKYPSIIERIMMSDRVLLLNVLDVPELGKSASRCLHHYVHLKYLAVSRLYCMKSFLVDSSFSKLLNLQVLILCVLSLVEIEVPDFIWGLVKLRHIDIRPFTLFPQNDSKKIKDSTVLLENLKSLSTVQLEYKDGNWLRKLPELQKLRCQVFHSFDDSLQEYRFKKLDLCNRLTSLKVEYNRYYDEEQRRCKLHLPPSLRKLSLLRFDLDSDDLVVIGKSLPNLEVLKLHGAIGKWIVNDEFPNLKVLEIYCFSWQWSFDEWEASEDSFPKLEQLWLDRCSIKKIPPIFGDIPNLRLISIKECNPSLHKSAREIQKV